jgi:hypothetical protein
MKIFNELENAYFIDCNGPFYALSENKNGCIALAFESEKFAKKFIKDQKNSFEQRGLDIEKIKATCIQDSFDFMILCAKNGLAGIELLSEEDRKSFAFYIDLSQTTSDLPSALVYDNDDTLRIKTNSKEYKDTHPCALKEWQRFDILDPLTATYTNKNPFNNWEEKQIYEIRTTSDDILCLFKLPCRGIYPAQMGAVPFFTNLELIFDFLEDRNFISHLAYYGGFDSKFNTPAFDLSDRTDFFKIVKINDLDKRLREINIGGIDFIINPNGTRNETGYGRCIHVKSKKALFSGISAMWEINKKNEFVKIKEKNTFRKVDSFYWNGFNPYKLKPIKKSTSPESSKTKHSHLKAKDLDLLIEDIFSDRKFKKSEGTQLTKKEAKKTKSDNYVIVKWDAISGYMLDGHVYFSSVLDLIQWIWQYECNHDYPIRTEGTAPHSGNIGIIKAFDLDFEKHQHEALRLALIAIFKRIVSKGYSPIEGDNLSGLINSRFKTIKVDLIAFMKDALLQTEGDEQIELQDVLS